MQIYQYIETFSFIIYLLTMSVEGFVTNMYMFAHAFMNAVIG